MISPVGLRFWNMLWSFRLVMIVLALKYSSESKYSKLSLNTYKSYQFTKPHAKNPLKIKTIS